MSEEKEVAIVEASSNIVEITETGERINFGKNGKINATYSVEENKVDFKLVTGELVSIDISTIPAEVLAEAAIYGIREKIKSTLSPIAAEDLAAKISKEFAQLQEGKFVTRSSDGGNVELDDFLVGFALVNATGTVNTGNGSFEVAKEFISVTELQPHWANVKDTTVIAEVQAFWDSLDRAEKAKQKRSNTFVNMQAMLVSTGVVYIA